MNNFDIIDSAFDNDDTTTINEHFNEIPKSMYNYFIDVALEDGREKMTKFLLSKNIMPSLYAKQIAEINGHISLAKYVESYFDFRNRINIKNVHSNLVGSQYIWNQNIPNEYRY